MPTEVILPKVDMDMATGQISRWFYREGDAIQKGEPLFEIETDKAAMEVDAPASGTLGRVTGATGVDIAVGSPVAWIFAEGEAVDAVSGTPDASQTPASTVSGPDPDVEVDPRSANAGEMDAVTGRADVTEAGKRCRPCSIEGGERRGVRATPLARRLARELGVDLTAITGRGPLGRIGRDDVERAAEKAVAAPTGPTIDRTCRTDQAAGTEAPGSALDRRAEAALARPPDPSPAAQGLGPSSQTGPLHLVPLRDGVGTPIVLIHGFGSESASWRPLLTELPAEIGPVIGLDLAGHGGSLAAEAQDFASLVAGAEDTLAAANLTACHLVGHSLGGAVAAAVGAGTATDVRSLMLIAPAGLGPDIDTRFTDGFARATEEAPIRAWLRHLVVDPASLSDGFIRATARGRADGRHAEAQTRLGASLFSNRTQHFEVRSLLARLAMPVAIVAGTEDRVVSIRHVQGLPGLIALHVFPGTGHLPQIERRADVARLLSRMVR